jgi:hypothetical protein
MTSRYFFRTLRRLFLYSSSHIPLSFRNNRRLWTSLGTAALISTTVYTTSPFERFTRSFIVHAKALEKDLSHTGRKSFLSLLIEILFNQLFISRKTIISSCS